MHAQADSGKISDGLETGPKEYLCSLSDSESRFSDGKEADMGKIPTREEAWELLTRYNQDAFHLQHAETVEGIMRYFAEKLGYADEADFWGIAGLLHDLDFEKYPEEHCVKAQEIMREEGLMSP